MKEPHKQLLDAIQDGVQSVMPPQHHSFGDIVTQCYSRIIKRTGRADLSPLSNPIAYAYRRGKWSALDARKEESKYAQLNETLPEPVLPSELLVEKEVAQALPELAGWFMNAVIPKLSSRDQICLAALYWEDRAILSTIRRGHPRAPAKGDERKAGKAWARRRARLLFRVYQTMRRELRNWPKGNELFGEALANPEMFIGLAALLRIWIMEGDGALFSAVQQTMSKARLQNAEIDTESMYESSAIDILVQEVLGGICTFQSGVEHARTEFGPQGEQQFHNELQSRIRAMTSAKCLSDDDKQRLLVLFHESHCASNELGD